MDTHSADVFQRAEFGYTSLVEFLLAAAALVHFPICFHAWIMQYGFVFEGRGLQIWPPNEASKSVACRPVAFESEACKSCVAFSLLVVSLVVGFSGVPMV